MTQHVDELAELYALGALDELERARVERHARGCAECARRLQQAEETVTVLSQAQPSHAPPAHLAARLSHSVAAPLQPRMHWPALTAIAAAFAIALIPTWIAVDRQTSLQAMRQDERALARLASARFRDAAFVATDRKPMDAKVLYGGDGSWYYIVVMHPKPDMRVAYVHGGHMEMLGTVAMHGESGTLYLPVNHKMEELALLQGATVVAHARLVY